MFSCSKFRVNRTSVHWDITEQKFSRWRPSAVLDLWNFDFSSCDHCSIFSVCYLWWRLFVNGEKVYLLAYLTSLRAREVTFWHYGHVNRSFYLLTYLVCPPLAFAIHFFAILLSCPNKLIFFTLPRIFCIISWKKTYAEKKTTNYRNPLKLRYRKKSSVPILKEE